MEAIGKFVNSISSAVEFNKATLSGCVDVVVVRQPDGSLKSSPFHVRFGKLKLLKSKDINVSISVNSDQTTLKMTLGEAGEGFFEEEILKSTFKSSSLINSKNVDTFEKASVEIIANSPTEDTNKRLAKLLDLKSYSSVSGQETSAGSDVNDNNGEGLSRTNSNNQNASEIIFLDEGRPKALSLQQVTSKSESLPILNCQRAHSVGSLQDIRSEKIKLKTLRPNSAQLESLNLKQGINTITYTVKSNLQGAQQVSGNIYLWPSDANIIISDIDGTITKSDVIGHLMSMVGRDWSQPGIAPLYTNIRRNGYHILYLTARAIGQAEQTKNFVNSVYQDGKMLPHGPLITSPDRMLSSVKREIIFKRPEVFKMAVLKDIRSLFPADHNPFHAGFGNRETDAIAYKSVGIPLDKVFIVNPKGDIHHHGDGIKKSYALINTMIKDIFPGILKSSKEKLIEKLNDENILNLEDSRLAQSNLIKVIC